MLDTTCLFLVRDATKLDARFFTELRTFVTPQLEFLTPILTDHWTKKQGYMWCPHFNFRVLPGHC
jgi:hypothetical protein